MTWPTTEQEKWKSLGEGGEMSKGNTGGFQGGATLLYDTGMEHAWRRAPVEHRRMHKRESEPQINNGL